MLVNYCDLCGNPIKGNNYFMLYVSTPKDTNFNEMEDYISYMKKVERGVKEICPTCKHIFDRIFELKLKKLCELTEEIDKIYKLPSKKNPKERNGKNKK
jgi:hypothetical protein